MCLGSLAACGGAGSAPASSPAAGLSLRSVNATYPVGLTAVGRQVWVANTGSGTVGPAGGGSTADVRVGSLPLRAAFDGRLLWVTVFGSGDVVAVDPARHTVVRRVHVGSQPEGIVAAFGGIWVVQQQAGRLIELTPSGRIEQRIRVGSSPRLVAAAGKALFVSDFGGNRIERVDPRDGTVGRSGRVCNGPQGMAAAADALWVTCTPDNAVVTLSLPSLHPLGRVTVPGEPDAIRADAGRVYVAATTGPTLSELGTDVHRPSVAQHWSLGTDPPLRDQANVDLLVVGTRFWVSSPNGGRVIAGRLPGAD